MPANHEMAFVCFGIAKVECQMLIAYFFSILYMPCMVCLKEKYAKKNKKQKESNVLYMIASVYFRICESYRIYLEGNSPYQTIMIMCELKWFSHILNHHNMKTLMQSCDIFHTQHAKFFATFDRCVGAVWFGHHKEYMC